MSRRTLINLVFFLFVFVLMCIWAVQNIVRIDAIDKPITAAKIQKSACAVPACIRLMP